MFYEEAMIKKSDVATFNTNTFTEELSKETTTVKESKVDIDTIENEVQDIDTIEKC